MSKSRSTSAIVMFHMPNDSQVMGQIKSPSLEEDAEEYLVGHAWISLWDPIILMPMFDPESGQLRYSPTDFMPYRQLPVIYFHRDASLSWCVVTAEAVGLYQKMVDKIRAQRSGIVLAGAGSLPK